MNCLIITEDQSTTFSQEQKTIIISVVSQWTFCPDSALSTMKFTFTGATPPKIWQYQTWSKLQEAARTIHALPHAPPCPWDTLPGATMRPQKTFLSLNQPVQLVLGNICSFWRQSWPGHLECWLVIRIYAPLLLGCVSWQMHQNSLQYFRH